MAKRGTKGRFPWRSRPWTPFLSSFSKWGVPVGGLGPPGLHFVEERLGGPGPPTGPPILEIKINTTFSFKIKKHIPKFSVFRPQTYKFRSLRPKSDQFRFPPGVSQLSLYD